MSRLANGAGWTAAVAGLVLVAGCGDAVEHPARSAAVPSTQAPFGQDTVRQEMDAAVVAAGLPEGETEAGFPKPRHWETTPTEDVPTENGGIYVIATYKKQGWILNARHSSMHPWVESTAMATKESCFDSLTDEETGILEDVD